MGRDLRVELSNKLDRIPLSYFDTQPSGDILSISTSDIDTMITALTNHLSGLISTIIGMTCAVALMLYMNITLSAVTILITIFFLFINKVIASKGQAQFIKHMTLIGEVNSQAEEVFSGHLVVKAFN